MTTRKVPIFILFFLCVSASLRLTSLAQVRPVYDQGALGLVQLINQLNSNARALMIGGHPDDEDTALLAYLSRGENARTAYLSLTRGDGGQNILGPELGDALGVIRTEELLQARKLDGAEQFFTRAYDYGFSKTLAEAKQKWDEQVIMCDVVQVIRSFRPQVVIAQFTGTPADGHGQHQFAGYITPIAVKAAGDVSQCKGAGAPWTVSKLYVRHRGQGEPTLRVNTGKYDPLLGRSYFEIAMHARSQHRSQEQGVLELKGDQFSNYTLVGGSSSKETGVFDGVELTVAGTPLPVVKFDTLNPRDLLSSLLSASTSSSQPKMNDAILRAASARIDVLADRETVVAGEMFPVAVRLFTALAERMKIVDVTFNFQNVKLDELPATNQSVFRREVANSAGYYMLSTPTNAKPTQPFWLHTPRVGELFNIPAGQSPRRPFQDPAVLATIAMEVDGKRIEVVRPVEYRYADDIRGEIRREVNVVPKITVSPDRNLLIVAMRAKQSDKEVSVRLTNNISGLATGKVRLVLPAGWTTSPAEADFAMTRKGESTSVRFAVGLPRNAAAGSYEIKAEAKIGEETFTETMQTIAYEHIQTHRIYRPATISVKLIDVQTAPVKVGYIRGSGDRVPEAIEQLGLAVEEIDDAMMAAGDLSRFDTIVVGIRAYQVRPSVVANNKRLLDYARNGGTLIVQYQLPATYSQLNLPPFPTQMGPRVADENAPVRIVEPAHPIMTFPNKITPTDFEGWVQERNLYNFSSMDPQYIGLLESHDAGEAENKGGLVVANLGKGKFVYCSYSLFRQLPAGVPGAHRLLANMVSLPKAR